MFHAVLHNVFEPLVAKWMVQGRGVQNQEGRRVTNVGFVDDVLLMAGAAQQIMLEELADKSAMVGLQLPYGKAKALYNKFVRESDHRTMLEVHGHMVDVCRRLAPANGRAEVCF